MGALQDGSNFVRLGALANYDRNLDSDWVTGEMLRMTTFHTKRQWWDTRVRKHNENMEVLSVPLFAMLLKSLK